MAVVTRILFSLRTPLSWFFAKVFLCVLCLLCSTRGNGEFPAETQRILSFCSVNNRTKHVKPNISAPGVEVGCKEGGVRRAILVSYFLCVSAVSFLWLRLCRAVLLTRNFRDPDVMEFR